MSDDWSLKMCLAQETISRVYYSPVDVETLRKKLIEDIKEEWSYTGQIHSEGDVIRIINKRFGVKE